MLDCIDIIKRFATGSGHDVVLEKRSATVGQERQPREEVRNRRSGPSAERRGP